MKSREETGPDPVDVHVGDRLRLRRTILGVSQADLGGVIGLSFQQIQKYERGSNRISASKLYRIAVALDVPVSFFFQDMDTDVLLGTRCGDSSRVDQCDPTQRTDILRLTRAYLSLPSERLRANVLTLLESMS